MFLLCCLDMGGISQDPLKDMCGAPFLLSLWVLGLLWCNNDVHTPDGALVNTGQTLESRKQSLLETPWAWTHRLIALSVFALCYGLPIASGKGASPLNLFLKNLS